MDAAVYNTACDLERFSIESRKKLSRRPVRRKEKTSRANPGDKDEIGFSFAYD